MHAHSYGCTHTRTSRLIQILQSKSNRFLTHPHVPNFVYFTYIGKIEMLTLVECRYHCIWFFFFFFSFFCENYFTSVPGRTRRTFNETQWRAKSSKIFPPMRRKLAGEGVGFIQDIASRCLLFCILSNVMWRLNLLAWAKASFGKWSHHCIFTIHQ